MLETLLITCSISIGTNLIIELSKHIFKKSKCRVKVEMGDKSETEILKLN
jgi:hypothetical protein